MLQKNPNEHFGQAQYFIPNPSRQQLQEVGPICTSVLQMRKLRHRKAAREPRPIAPKWTGRILTQA